MNKKNNKMKNLLLILITLVCSSVYSQTIDTTNLSLVSDTLKTSPTPYEVQVDTTNGIKTRVIDNKVYYIKETQKITIKYEEND